MPKDNSLAPLLERLGASPKGASDDAASLLASWHQLLRDSGAGDVPGHSLGCTLPGQISVQPLSLARSPEIERASSAAGMLRGRACSREATSRIEGPFVDLACTQIVRAAELGARSVTIVLDEAGRVGQSDRATVAVGGVSVADAKELAELLAVVCEHKMTSVIECGSSGASVAAMLASVPSHVSACVIGVRHDPWSEKLRGKQPACSLQSLLDQALLAIEIAEQLPALKTACAVDARLVAESGGTSVQELSFALSAVAQLLRAAETRGVTPRRILNTVEVLFSQGSDVFLEIAKLRAFRVLWSNLCESFEEVSLPRVTAVGSIWNITTDETHTNLLRLTASVLSAVSGGATRVELPPFTGEAIQQDSFASDLSIGLQHVVAHESRLFDVIDPAGGSFYVEDLTRSLAEAAWEQFRAHERLGGLVSVLEKGQFQQEISREAALRAEAVHSGRAIFVGLNKFRSEPVSPTTEDENMRARRESRQQELVNREAKSPRVANLTSAKELLEGAEKGATLQALSNGLRAKDAKSAGKTVLVSIPVFRVQRIYDESLPAL